MPTAAPIDLPVAPVHAGSRPTDADALWQTLLFTTPAATTTATRAGMSPRLAFQLVLHRRAVIVDRRSSEQRASEGEIDATLGVVTDLAAAELTGIATIVVIGPVDGDHRHGRGVVPLEGGVPAWAAAGLPLAVSDAMQLAA